MSDAADSAKFDKSRAELFDALGHPVRIRIIHALQDGPLSFSDLRRRVGLESSGHLQFHLGKLTGLVKVLQDGSYSLSDDGHEALRMVQLTSDTLEASPAKRRRQLRMTRSVLAVMMVIIVVLASVVVLQQLNIISLNESKRTSSAYTEVPSYRISGNGTIIPVLLMQPGATSTVVVTFRMSVTVTPEMLNETGSMFAARYPSGIAYFGYIHQDEILPGSQPIVTMVSPLGLNITNWPAGTTFNVTYTMTASSNSTGFYTSPILMGACVDYPLAVGYSASQVNASDIEASYSFPACPASAFERETVLVANMAFVNVFVPSLPVP